MYLTNTTRCRFHLFLTLVGISILTFILRSMPLILSAGHPVLKLNYDPDVTYHLRQIELLLANFPDYPWFDAMARYPGGSVVQWGPLLAYIGTGVTLIIGGSTRSDIIWVTSLIPPIIASLTIPVIFLLGRTIRDTRCGLNASLLFAIFPGMLFYRSYYGFFDHHVLEVFCTTILSAGYILALSGIRGQENKTIIIGMLLAGGGYSLSVLISPMVVIFGVIIGVVTFCYSIRFHGEHSTNSFFSLTILNITTFLPPIIILVGLGIQYPGLKLTVYSILHPIVYAGILALAPSLWLCSTLYTRIQKRRITGIIIGIILFGCLITALKNLILMQIIKYHLMSLFGVSNLQNSIVEAGPWNISAALSTYHTGFLLLVFGGILLVLEWYRSKRVDLMYLIVWSVLMVILTIQHWRFEYYLAIPFILLCAYVISSQPVMDLIEKLVSSFIRKRPDDAILPKKGKYAPNISLFAVLILGLTVIFSAGSIIENLRYSPHYINGDWEDALNWLYTNSPDPGYEYTGLYDRTSFSPPSLSYGVLSWWTSGHGIIWLSHRVPYTNPFQEGAHLAADILLETDEERVASMMKGNKGKYLITDTGMVSDTMPSILAWDDSPGKMLYSMNTRGNGISTLLAPDYYQALITRLHIYDGSHTEPDQVFLVTYTPESSNSTQEVDGTLGTIRKIDYENAVNRVQQWTNDNPDSNEKMIIAQSDISQTSIPLKAIRHFRLVYESNTSTDSTIYRPDGKPYRTFSFVKIFEFVQGAKIKGEGTVQLTLQTNTGRRFTYEQESQDGYFILSYPTDECIGGTCPVGKYLMQPSGLSLTVNESTIQSGE